MLKEGGTVVHNYNMDDMQPIEMRRRIRELLSIPDRDRTDAEWDELNELEIRTAPGNRDYDRSLDRQGERRPGGMGQQGQQGRRPDRNPKQGNKNNNNNNNQNQQRQPMPQEGRPDGRQEGRLLKRQHRRPKRQGQGTQGQTENSGNVSNAPASSGEYVANAEPAPPPASGGESSGNQ